MQCHDDSDEEHPLAGMHPNAEGEDQEAEMAQALDDSIDIAIIAEANIAKGNKSIECVSALSAMVMFRVNVLPRESWSTGWSCASPTTRYAQQPATDFRQY